MRAASDASPEVVAGLLLEGFDRHYALFRDCARAAKRDFEAGNWLGIGHLTRDRIDFYDRRVAETVERLERELRFTGDDAFWARVKQRFIVLTVEHRQPECAETFFNTVSSKLLHRTYFHNRCLFVRPAASTEYLDDGAPAYRCYYPRRLGLRAALIDLVLDLTLDLRFATPRFTSTGACVRSWELGGSACEKIPRRWSSQSRPAGYRNHFRAQ
jgi:isocitrate dehydrogenase kinase/phosphatase